MNSYKKVFRLLSVAGALGALALGLSACDASPYAASVNGQVITVNSFNHDLADWAANPGVVQGFSQTGASVVGAGGSGTYSSKFAARIMGILIEALSVHQRLAAQHNPATADELATARAVDELVNAPYWTRFSPQLRQFLVQGLADQGVLAQAPKDPSSLQGPYSQIQQYLFSELCVVQATAFNQADAQSIGSSGVPQGARVCYDQAGVEAQPTAIQTALLKLANPGDISDPVPSGGAFVVMRLVSRVAPSFNSDVQKVLVAATSQVADVATIVSAARVKINPRYGTWGNDQVNPPPAPQSS